MSICKVRKQGGAAVVTIPSTMLKLLDLQIGSELELIIDKENLILHPTRKKRADRRRYTLKELLRGVTAKKMKELNKKTEWAREGQAVGREIA